MVVLQLVDPVCGIDDPTPSIPVLLVTNQSGWDILETLSITNLTLSPFTPHSVPFDPATLVTLLIAVVTVVLGSYIANSPFQFLRFVPTCVSYHSPSVGRSCGRVPNSL